MGELPPIRYWKRRRSPLIFALFSKEDAKFLDGVPVLAIEILSPGDTVEESGEKVDAYLNAGVSLVWEVSPKYKAVTVHRPGMPPELFNVTQDLTAEPHLRGLRIPVAEIFEM